MAILKLKDENETVNFLDRTNYKLLDDTFEMSPPERVELRVQDNFFAGKDLLRMEYAPRRVSFEVMVLGDTQKQVSENVSKIQRLLSRASSLTYLQGGAYNQNLSMGSGNDTGDHGVILQLRRGFDVFSTITSEYSNDAISNNFPFTMRVISGDVEVTEKLFSAIDMTSRPVATTLLAAMNDSQTTIDVVRNAFTNGEYIVLWTSSGVYEVMAITSSASTITGGYRYNVTRNADGNGALAWAIGLGVYNITGNYFRTCTVTLETEPFILGPSRVIATEASPGYQATPKTSNSHINREFIEASSVPGDVEALTRISTKMNNASGVIIARDAGISLLNCPSYPTLDTGKDDVFVYGQLYTTSNQSLKININGTGTPNTFRFSNNGGLTWGPTTNITAWTPIQLEANSGLTDAYAVFGSTTGFTSNQTWTFVSHQAYFENSGSAIDTYTQRTSLMGEDGYSLYSFYVNVPPGCRSRYKMIASISSDILAEYRMRVNFIGRGLSGADIVRVASEPQYYEWVGPFETKTVSLGIIDFTSLSTPFMAHPYSSTVIQIFVYARTTEEIVTDTADTIKFNRGFLIPVQDEFSHMHAAWKVDGAGREVYSNYDAANPYIAEETANMLDGDYSGRVNLGLDATYGGNIITLIPNVKQTLMFVPLLSVSTDWRAATLTTSGETGGTYVAIRPRYLHLPG